METKMPESQNLESRCTCAYRDGNSEHNWHEINCPAEKYARRWLDSNTWSDEKLVCPYCGDVTDLSEGWGRLPRGFEHDGQCAWIACDQCGRELRVTLSVTYEVRTDPVYWRQDEGFAKKDGE